MAHSLEAASDDSVSPCNLAAAGRGQDYWRGVADGIAQAGGIVPPDVAARAGRAGAPPGRPADALDFDPVPLRRREDGLTPEKQRAYVEALADTGVARAAAARAGGGEKSVARARRRADGRSFDRACRAARRIGARQLLSTAFERAVEGTLKGHYYHGERIGEERVYDNRLLIFLLGRFAHLLDEPDDDSRAICENWEPFMDALEQGLPPPALSETEGPGSLAAEAEDEDPGDDQVWLEDGVWLTFFPPPPDFDGEEEGELGDRDYQRTLTGEEEAAVLARRRRDDEAELARCCAMRDRFFGLAARGAPGLSVSRQAGPYGPSGPAAGLPEPFDRGSGSDITAGQANSEGGSG
jgi:hypothetical protein